MAIIEIVLGAVFGNLGFLQVTDWMTLVTSLGGILLTFLAGTEININLMREKYKESFLMGFCSFLAPFIDVSLYIFCYGMELRGSFNCWNHTFHNFSGSGVLRRWKLIYQTLIW
ncbi:MAG: cation:proton antiporter [Methanobacterium sp.]